MNNETIVLTGGGTAGHVTPNINMQKELSKHFNKIVYIGSKTGIEKNLVKSRTNYEYREIDTVKFIRKKLFKNLLIPFKLSKAINDAKSILKEIKPSVIFSKGGYVSLPVAIAGKKLGIPVVSHESDLSMGLANKISKRYSTKICTNFELTARKNGKKCVHTGTPLIMSQLSKEKAKEKLNIPKTKPMLLITGGSLGAKSINQFITENLEALTKKYYIVHLVGNGNLNNKIKNDNYNQIEFTNDMQTLYRATDFAISRAGANTIFELLANGIPSVFIPLPKNASRGDQIDNANYTEALGLSKTILQENLNIDTLLLKLNYIEKNAKKIKTNIKNHQFNDGTAKIIKIILKEKIKQSA